MPAALAGLARDHCLLQRTGGLGLIILWRGGLVSFGQALFFAIGAYCVALLSRFAGMTDAFLMILVGGVVAALVAFVVGFLLARYREIFFAMLSLAVSMILYGVLVKSESLGSTDGINVPQARFLGTHPMARCSGDGSSGSCSAPARSRRFW